MPFPLVSLCRYPKQLWTCSGAPKDTIKVLKRGRGRRKCREGRTSASDARMPFASWGTGRRCTTHEFGINMRCTTSNMVLTFHKSRALRLRHPCCWQHRPYVPPRPAGATDWHTTTQHDAPQVGHCCAACYTRGRFCLLPLLPFWNGVRVRVCPAKRHPCSSTKPRGQRMRRSWAYRAAHEGVHLVLDVVCQRRGTASVLGSASAWVGVFDFLQHHRKWVFRT